MTGWPNPAVPEGWVFGWVVVVVGGGVVVVVVVATLELKSPSLA
jgi:hypothetical protein